MYADVIINNELKAGEPNSVIWQRGERERMVRIADVHHYLRARSCLFFHGASFDGKLNFSLVDVPLCALCARNRSLYIRD